MKRIPFLVVVLLMLVTLFSACGTQINNPDESASAVGKETEGTTLTQPQQDTPPTLTLEEEFQKLIQDNRWYWRTLGCVFEKPEDIPAYFYFYLGVGENGQFTAEESAFLADAYKEKNPNGNYDVVSDIKLPVAKINEALSVLSVTIEDIKIPDQWVYYDKTDSYYFWVSDAYGITDWSVTKVEKGTEGMVAVYWETDEISILGLETPSKVAKMALTLQQQHDGTYRILSNIPQG